jgi:hypothetical protein
MATQEATKMTPSQAVCWLARRLDPSGAKWIAPAMMGTDVDSPVKVGERATFAIRADGVQFFDPGTGEAIRGA